MSRYPTLFSPLSIGNVTVRNRVMQTAHVKLFAWGGVDSKRNVDYQVERAKGGAGLLITGNRLVHPSSFSGMPRFAYGFRDEAREVNRRMADGVHKHGGVIFEQLNHFGLNASSDSGDDFRVNWGPSAVKSPAYGETPKAMEHEEIAEVVSWWGRCAEMTRDSGFDGTEVHISHSYLLHQFLSPVYNKREDEYGGSLENRLRFTREVIAEVRRKVGEDWVVGIRLSLSDFIPGALDDDDAVAVAQMLEADGQIDFVNVTAAGYHNIHRAIEPSDASDGYLVDLAAKVKEAVSLPVFTIGGIKDPALAEEILAAGKADMVAMTRGQIADPFFARKAMEGREDEIVHCIRGNQGCIGRVFKGLPITCTVNPAAGREARFGEGTLIAADLPARWVVVGGGPAGMRAALTLARRGHEVVLIEREAELGGQVNLITRTPGRAEFGWVRTDLERLLAKQPVEIRLATEATADLIHSLGADGVLIATGAVPDRSGFSTMNPMVDRLPGVDQPNVLHAWDVIAGAEAPGNRVVVLDGDGGRYAAGTCEVLLDQGKQVEVVTAFNALFPTTFTTLDMATLYGRLMSKGLTDRVNHWATAIEGTTVRTVNLYTGQETVLAGVDAVVLATGPKADDGLYHALKGTVANLHRIGDCVAPRKLDHAIYEGELAGRELWDPEERYIFEGELEQFAEEVTA